MCRTAPKERSLDPRLIRAVPIESVHLTLNTSPPRELVKHAGMQYELVSVDMTSRLLAKGRACDGSSRRVRRPPRTRQTGALSHALNLTGTGNVSCTIEKTRVGEGGEAEVKGRQ